VKPDYINPVLIPKKEPGKEISRSNLSLNSTSSESSYENQNLKSSIIIFFPMLLNLLQGEEVSG
jgi:hypothetical protein